MTQMIPEYTTEYLNDVTRRINAIIRTCNYDRQQKIPERTKIRLGIFAKKCTASLKKVDAEKRTWKRFLNKAMADVKAGKLVYLVNMQDAILKRMDKLCLDLENEYFDIRYDKKTNKKTAMTANKTRINKRRYGHTQQKNRKRR